jgi:hypothetical protein
MALSPYPFISRLLCSALAVCSLLSLTQSARADANDLVPIYNNFEEGLVPFGDGFPSAAGGSPGWANGWTTSSIPNIIANVISDNPLNGGNNYLNFTITNTTSQQAVRRQYGAYLATGSHPLPDYNTFAVPFTPQQVSFDIRVDGFTNAAYTTNFTICDSNSVCFTTNVYSAPPTNGTIVTNRLYVDGSGTNTWSGANDNVFVSGMSGASSAPGGSSSWEVYAQGAASGVNGPAGAANRWLLWDGNTVNTATGSGKYVDSGMSFSNGVVYHFDIVTDPRDKVYWVTVTDGVTTNRSPVLRWRSAADPAQNAAGASVTVGGGLTSVNSALTISFDTLTISQLPPSVFPPRITQITPDLWPPIATNLASRLTFTPQINPPVFYLASKGISFVASTAGGGSNDLVYGTNAPYVLSIAHTTISNSGIGLVVNGVDVSGSLGITGQRNYKKVSYNGLVANTKYVATILVTNSAGAYTTRTLTFDTFDEKAARVIEAEDYNYGDGGFTRPSGSGSAPTVGGAFQENPAPSDFLFGAYLNQSSGYVDRMGYTTNGANIDYFVPNTNFGGTPTNANPALNFYRFFDSVATTPVVDYPRPKYVVSGARDYQVANIRPGQWMNYTRTFAPGNYTIYLRASSTATGSGGINSVNLDMVTSDPTQPGQTTTNVGTFAVPYTGTAGVFTNVALSFTNGGPTVALGGQQTLRLTAVNAGNNLQLNCLVLVPGAANAPSVAIATPANGASFGSGANISLTASASAGAGISKVEYFNGATSLGSSTASPYTVSWNSVPTGTYTITAVATTSTGFSASAAPVSIKVGSPAKRVLLIEGQALSFPNGTVGDQFAQNMAIAKGWNVSVHWDTNMNAIGPAAANGFDLILQSTTGPSGNQNVIMRDVPVPLIGWNQALLNRMAFNKDLNGFDYGPSGSQQAAVFVSTNDPAAAGYSGVQNLSANLMPMCYSYPNENAIIITKYIPDPGLWANNLYYKSGAEMLDGVIAPGLRYQYFTIDNHFATNVTAVSSNLLWAAMDVAVSNPLWTGYPVTLGAPSSGGGMITIPFTAGGMDITNDFSLWSSPNVNGPYTLDTSAVITGPTGHDFVAVTPAGPARFFRIRRIY